MKTMIYIRKIYNQDIDANHQMQIVKEPAYSFFNYLYNPAEKNLGDKTFTIHLENFYNEEGCVPIIASPITSRIYQSSATKKGKTTCEARLGSDLRNFLKSNLQFEVGDIIVFRNKKGKSEVDYDNIYVDYVSSKSILYKAYNAFLQNENHCVALASEYEIERPTSLDSFPLQQIYYGAPGTGKSHIINEITEGESVIRTTFHPDSDYSTFVGAYKPTTKEITMRDLSGHPIMEGGKVLTEDKIVYEFVEQAFLQAYVQAWKYYAEVDAETKPKKQYLVIEEINRGNCAQIFGDLFQLLDRNTSGFSDYPINADNDMKKQLAKAFKGLTVAQADSINACYKGKDVVSKVLSGEILLLPNNLYIWATMNTSDQSLFPIDSAFKRRWDWQYMPISKGMDNGTELNWKITADTKEYDWWSFLEKINAHVGTTTNSEDKKLGFFFCKAVDGIISAEAFVGKVIFYLWNDVFKDFGFEGPIFKDVDGSELSFNKFYKTDNAGRTIVQKDKVEQFLKNLGVEEFVETEGSDAKEFNEASSYTINGVKKDYLYEIAYQVVSDYVSANQQKSAQEIRDYFVDSCRGVGIAHIVETEAEYHTRDGQKSQTRSAKELEMPNGEKIYVSTQWRSKLPNDNFILFIETAKNNSWGTIAPAE